MEDANYGKIKVKLEEKIKERNLSKNKLAFKAEIQRTQLNRYCSGNIQRIDVQILCRLCYALECSIEDLFEYVPPEK